MESWGVRTTIVQCAPHIEQQRIKSRAAVPHGHITLQGCIGLAVCLTDDAGASANLVCKSG